MAASLASLSMSLAWPSTRLVSVAASSGCPWALRFGLESGFLVAGFFCAGFLVAGLLVFFMKILLLPQPSVSLVCPWPSIRLAPPEVAGEPPPLATRFEVEMHDGI